MVLPMTFDTAALLTRLTEATGVSGHEIEIAAAVREAFAPHVDTLREDALGNLIGYRRGSWSAEDQPALSVLLASHQDEIGLMVTAIEEGGFLRITGVGGWDPRVLLAQPVLVHGQAAPLPGVVGSRPPHVLGPDAQKKVIPMDELFIDIGLSEDEVRARVRVGDVVTMRRRTQKLGGDRWAGKAMDNRASVLAVAVALEALGGRRPAWDVYAVATTQEEIGLKGAATAGWGVQPTIAVALDVTFAKQPGASDVPYKLGGGPVLAFGPNIHPRIFERLCAAADALEMAYQVEPAAGATGTDAWALQVARGGIPTGLVGIPLRYMHSTVETVSLKDIERSGRLIAQFITGLDADFAAGLVEGVDEL
jgi:putative aminopeptidase FrvX